MSTNFTLYHSGKTQDPKNTKYPHASRIYSEQTLQNAVRYDHVAVQYLNNTRGKDNFIQSDVIMLDVDNEGCSSKVTKPKDIASAFPDVEFWVVYSRNHMKPKHGEEPVPRFHVYFPIKQTKSREKYEALKAEIVNRLPSVFDKNALDSGRFFYGVENPRVEYFSGKGADK